jgi:transcription elongation GreA/GreB family factor
MGTSGMTGAVATPLRLRDEVDEALERLSQLLVRHGRNTLKAAADDTGAGPQALARIQETVRFLGQVASGWQNLPDEALPGDGAGFGSTVVVDDLDLGGRETYTLMTGALLDIDAGQVSLASPIGRALLGTTPGAEVSVSTPQRQRRLRVISVCTLRDRLNQAVLEESAM